MGIQFMKDCLSRKMNLSMIARKYNMDIDEVFNVYVQERKNYTKEQIDQIMQEVFCCD